jgi:hypothetical protein
MLICSSIPFVTNAYELLDYRFKTKVWPMGFKTKHKRDIRKGDRLLFYIAGQRKNSKVFVAKAVSDSDVHKIKIIEPEEWWITIPVKGLRLTNISYLKRPVPIKQILEQMSFIGPGKHWGPYLQGGCKLITKEDYNLILNLSNSKGN